MSRRRHFGFGRIKADVARKHRVNERRRLTQLFMRVVGERPDLGPRLDAYLDLQAAVIKEGVAIRDLVYSVVPQQFHFSDMALDPSTNDDNDKVSREKFILAHQAELERTLPSIRDILNRTPPITPEEQAAQDTEVARATAVQEAAQEARRQAVVIPMPAVAIAGTAGTIDHTVCPRCNCEMGSTVHLSVCGRRGLL